MCARAHASAPEPSPESTIVLSLFIPVSAMISPISFDGIVCGSLRSRLYKSINVGSRRMNSLPVSLVSKSEPFGFDRSSFAILPYLVSTSRFRFVMKYCSSSPTMCSRPSTIWRFSLWMRSFISSITGKGV